MVAGAATKRRLHPQSKMPVLEMLIKLKLTFKILFTAMIMQNFKNS